MIERRQGVGTVESSGILTKALWHAAAIADQRGKKSSSQGMLVQLNDSVAAPCIDWRFQTIQRQISQACILPVLTRLQF